MHSTKKILVIVESQTNFLIIEDVLIKAGYEVELCNHPKQALNKIYNNIPDLIILDLILPNMDGLTFYEKIAHLCIPTIIISGKFNPMLRERAKKQGIIDFIFKPIKIQQLLDTITLVFIEPAKLDSTNHYIN